MAEVARGYLGTLFLARDPADPSERGAVLVRHVVPIATASAKSALLEAARWAHATGAPTLEILENRNGVDVVTAFYDLEPLRSLLRTAALKHATLDVPVLLGIARGLIEQLDAAHDAATGQKSPHGFGGVHPDSIVVGTDGRVELIDCGIGSAASAREPWRSDPQRIGYFAPEQLDGKTVDGRTDVFSLGVLLWEAIANKRLFPAVDAKSARDRVLKGTIARLDATRSTATAPAVSTEIANLVAKALERDPAARFQSVEELDAALAALGPAKAAQIGTWVSTLAETAITKRRQSLERASTASIPPPSSPPSASLRPRPSVPPAAGRPSVAPKPPSKPPGLASASTASEDAAPSSVPTERSVTPPPSAETPAPSTEVSAAPPAAVTEGLAEKPAPAKRPPAAAAAPPRAASVTPTPAPPRAASVTPTPAPPRAASVAQAPAPPRPASIAPTPAPPRAASVTPTPAPPRAASVTPTPAPPPSADAAPPAAPPPAAESPAAATSAAAADDAAPESSAPTQPSGVEPDQRTAPTNELPTVPKVSADAVPRAEASAEDAEEMDVSDDELGASPSAPSHPPPPTSRAPMHPSSLPPKLPDSVEPPVALLGEPTEQLASPFRTTSDLGMLTAAPRRRRRRIILAVGGALVAGLAVGFFVLGRVRGKPQPIRVPYKEEAVAGTVEIVAQEPAPTPSASAAAPGPSAAVAPVPSASAAPAEAPPPEAPQPAPPSGAPENVSAPSGASPSGQHRPPPSHGPVNSGYKPGGI